jgi:uncharacterized protein (TIGR03067 family)
MTFAACLVMASRLFVALGADDAADKAQSRLEGVWRFALVEVNRVKQPEVPFATHRMILSKDGRYVVVQGPRITRGTLKVDPTQVPMSYDPVVHLGGGKTLSFPGIYQQEGDTLKICLPLRGKVRPTGFDSKPDSGLMIQVFERETKSTAEALLGAARLELAGTWQAVTYALDGVKASDEDMKKVKLTFDRDGKTEASNEGKVFIASTTKIDPTKEPMTIDISFTQGSQKGQTSLGIYKIDGNVLTICRASPGSPRPTEFASQRGSRHTLMTYKKEAAVR